DLKPENIFFRADGSVVLIDFNISTPFGKTPRDQLQKELMGSPYYMSPEQSSRLPVDGRSDLYSLGVVLFEALTGVRPFTGDNSVQIIYRHLHEEIPLLPRALRHLQPLVDSLLAKLPDERIGTVDALHGELQRYLDDPLPAGASGAPQP
ncbi:MAG TPA: protein kinase, partial [Usitatibacteraceae bacterium]|nr:protein kinase [Usitatibacteraceae bacterium]